MGSLFTFLWAPEDAWSGMGALVLRLFVEAAGFFVLVAAVVVVEDLALAGVLVTPLPVIQRLPTPANCNKSSLLLLDRPFTTPPGLPAVRADNS